MNPIALKVAADLMAFLQKKHGERPPPEFEKKVAEQISAAIPTCPVHGTPSGILVVQAFCMCETCQESRAAAVRLSAQMAGNQAFLEQLMRNARKPSMN